MVPRCLGARGCHRRAHGVPRGSVSPLPSLLNADRWPGVPAFRTKKSLSLATPPLRLGWSQRQVANEVGNNYDAAGWPPSVITPSLTRRDSTAHRVRPRAAARSLTGVPALKALRNCSSSSGAHALPVFGGSSPRARRAVIVAFGGFSS